ncbi:MAG TPA: hypothetical protein VMA32_17430 [Streptosporangiaceae bacterium]|nr:hypothetical protein [Streptosporangiaceae bacterium]
MNWFWMNVPLEVVFFAAWVGIPLWLVARHRHWGSDPASPQGNPELEALVIARADAPQEVDRGLAAILALGDARSEVLAADRG